MAMDTEKEVAEDPQLRGISSPLAKMNSFLLVKVKGSSRDREAALPPGTSFDFVVWVDLGAAWAFLLFP